MTFLAAAATVVDGAAAVVVGAVLGPAVVGVATGGAVFAGVFAFGGVVVVVVVVGATVVVVSSPIASSACAIDETNGAIMATATANVSAIHVGRAARGDALVPSHERVAPYRDVTADVVMATLVSARIPAGSSAFSRTLVLG